MDRVWCAVCAEHELSEIDIESAGLMALVEGDVVVVVNAESGDWEPVLAEAEPVDYAEGRVVA